jgi:hypothetical protein
MSFAVVGGGVAADAALVAPFVVLAVWNATAGAGSSSVAASAALNKNSPIRLVIRSPSKLTFWKRETRRYG